MKNVSIQFVHIPTSESLANYIQKKLIKIFKHYNKLIKVNVYIKKIKDFKNGGKVCEIELKRPNAHLFASANENDYQVAVKKTIESIKRQLTKQKTTH